MSECSILSTKEGFITPKFVFLTLCIASMELEIGVTHSDLSLVESWFSSDTSSGYLEDAIAGWGTWCNQHNLPSHSQEHKRNNYLVDQEGLFPTFSSTTSQIILHDNCLTESHNFNTSRNISISSSQDDAHVAEVKHIDSSQRSSASRESDENDASVSKSSWKRIVYPFEVVKRGGVEGETTLKDINEQMLMTPSKPIPHPVGHSSLPHPHSSCISNRGGYGLSGKQVAALTRIHTQGTGSITIIRTKG